MALATGLWKQLEAGDATSWVTGSRGTQWWLLISTGCVPGRGAVPQPSPGGFGSPPAAAQPPGRSLAGGPGLHTQPPFSPAAEPPVCKQPARPSMSLFSRCPPGQGSGCAPAAPPPWASFAGGSIAGVSAGPREPRPVPRLGLALLIAAAAL